MSTTRHLSDDDIARYLGGTSPPADLLRADDHLAGCDACRGRMDVVVRAPAKAGTVKNVLRDAAFEHPAPDRITAYVDGALEPSDREAVEVHLQTCDLCSQDVDDLQAVATTPAATFGQTNARRYAWTGLAAAAALAALVVWSRWPVRSAVIREARAPETTAAGGRTSASASIVASIRDGAGTVTLDADGGTAGLPAMTPADRDAVAAALRDGRLDVPPDVAALRGRTGRLLGSPIGTPAYRPVQPTATAVESDRPRFEWTAAPRATAYVVSVFDESLDKVAESDPQSTLQWTPRSPLPRGAVYSWQVRARTPNGDLIAPAPPAPEARFLVLSPADADRAASLRRDYAASPLTLGVLFARAGLMLDAERQFTAVADANPSSREVQQLLDGLRRQDPSPTTKKPAQ